MKTINTIFFLLTIFLSFISVGQEKVANGFEPIRTELAQWDAIRGPWLASSIEAIANDQPIPQRTFPENFTPNQMLRMVDVERRTAIQNTVNNQRTNSQDTKFWNKVNRTVTSVNCSPMQGRTYGDPHMISFDGARYSFQTVGEFVLTKSSDGQVEVQTRQKPQSDDFSLNTAVAMNVAGDRLAIYAEDYPDADYSTPVRLNGRSLQLNGSTYFLDHGGTIQKSGQSYFIHWPNGESAEVTMRSSGGMGFMDVSVNILPCVVSSYDGVLGNADGIERNDFEPGFVIPHARLNDPFEDDNYINRERQAYIAKVLADQYRVDDFTTLFDYAIGRNTMTFTDRSFPRVYRTIDDLDQRNRDRARQRCEQNGISSRDMNGCIFDNAFLELEPPKQPRNNDPVAQTPTLRSIDREVINRNTVSPTPTTSATNPVKPSNVGATTNTREVEEFENDKGSTNNDIQTKTPTGTIDKTTGIRDTDTGTSAPNNPVKNTSTPSQPIRNEPTQRSPDPIKTSPPSRSPEPTFRAPTSSPKSPSSTPNSTPSPVKSTPTPSSGGLKKGI